MRIFSNKAYRPWICLEIQENEKISLQKALNTRVIQKGQKFQMMEIPISQPKFLLLKSKAFQKYESFQKILISRYCYLHSKF